MTEEEFYQFIRNNVFISQEEWVRILQNEEHDILIDYDQVNERNTLSYAK